MKISCNLCIEYGDSRKAEQILRSIKVDDFDFVASKVDEKMLKAEIKSTSVSSLLHTPVSYTHLTLPTN